MATILKYKETILIKDFLETLEIELQKTYESNVDNIQDILSTYSINLKISKNNIEKYTDILSIFMPIVRSIYNNSEVDDSGILLLTLGALSIWDRNNNMGKLNKKEIKSILEELRLKGIGEGVVKKIVSVFESLDSLIKQYTNDNTSLNVRSKESISFINTIYYMIDKYKLNLDNIGNNLNTLMQAKNIPNSKITIDKLSDIMKGIDGPDNNIVSNNLLIDKANIKSF